VNEVVVIYVNEEIVIMHVLEIQMNVIHVMETKTVKFVDNHLRHAELDHEVNDHMNYKHDAKMKQKKF
jgi:hypothetical protein